MKLECFTIFVWIFLQALVTAISLHLIIQPRRRIFISIWISLVLNPGHICFVIKFLTFQCLAQAFLMLKISLEGNLSKENRREVFHLQVSNSVPTLRQVNCLAHVNRIPPFSLTTYASLLLFVGAWSKVSCLN